MTTIEEVSDDLIRASKVKKVIKGTPTVFPTDSTLLNPIFYDYSISNAPFNPPARYGHSSVLIGNDMYVFGGIVNGSCTNDFYKFNLVTNIWSQISEPGMPSSRAFFVMLTKGNLIYIHGGVNYTTSIRTASFDNNPRVAFNLDQSNNIVLAANKSIVSESLKQFYSDTYVFDTLTGQWSVLTITGTVYPRAYSSGFVYGNFICLTGGLRADPAGTGVTIIYDDFSYFDLTEKVWKHIIDNNIESVWGHSTILIGTKLLRFYGFSHVDQVVDANLTPYKVIVSWNITSSGTTITILPSTVINEVVANTNSPLCYAFFSLYYDGALIYLINGVNYATITSTATIPGYYKTFNGTAYYNYSNVNIRSAIDPTNLIASGGQNWLSKINNFLSTPLIHSTLVVKGINLYFFGGRNTAYSSSQIVYNYNTPITTFGLSTVLVGRDTLIINNYTFKVLNRNGKVYIIIFVDKGNQNLSLLSLRILGT